jgi:hypothetical protein
VPRACSRTPPAGFKPNVRFVTLVPVVHFVPIMYTIGCFFRLVQDVRFKMSDLSQTTHLRSSRLLSGKSLDIKILHVKHLDIKISHPELFHPKVFHIEMFDVEMFRGQSSVAPPRNGHTSHIPSTRGRIGHTGQDIHLTPTQTGHLGHVRLIHYPKTYRKTFVIYFPYAPNRTW